MNIRVTRRFVLGGLGSVAAQGAAWANAPVTSLRPRMPTSGGASRAKVGGAQALIANSGVTGLVACAVADVKTGLRLEAVNGAAGVPPASVAKTLTTLYALDALGPDYRFRTRLIADGPVVNGILNGDLVLAGGGDPTLNTDSLAVLAQDLKTAGVREVRGKLRVYEGALPYVRSIDDQQPDHVGYSPAVSGIALNYNRVHFEWKRAAKGYAVAMDARTKKYRPEVHMARMKVVNRRMPVYTYTSKSNIDQWTVASRALGKAGSRWLPVRKPALYAGEVFATMARAQGIKLSGPEVTRSLKAGGRVLAQTESAPLKAILKLMLKYSNNLTAEMVGMTASVARGRKPASLKESARQMNAWAAKEFGMTGTRLVDHSGLEPASRMTADDLVRVLVQVRKKDILRPLLKPIPMRDARGRIIKGHPIKVNAKTGTLNFVSGLGGFMTTADGNELAFAIFSANTDKRARINRADRDVPEGARAWNRKSKMLQQKLIQRWGTLYGAS